MLYSTNPWKLVDLPRYESVLCGRTDWQGPYGVGVAVAVAVVVVAAAVARSPDKDAAFAASAWRVFVNKKLFHVEKMIDLKTLIEKQKVNYFQETKVLNNFCSVPFLMKA